MALLVTVPAEFVDLPHDARERLPQHQVYGDLKLFHKFLGEVPPVYGVIETGRVRVTGRFEYGLIAKELGFARVQAIVRDPISNASVELLAKEPRATIVPVPRLTAEEQWGARVEERLHLIGFTGDAAAAIPSLAHKFKPLFLDPSVEGAHDFEIDVASEDSAVAYFSAMTPVGQPFAGSLRRCSQHYCESRRAIRSGPTSEAVCQSTTRLADGTRAPSQGATDSRRVPLG